MALRNGREIACTPERLLAHVARQRGRNGCELWKGAHDSHGYGVVYINGRQHKAHRIAWELAHGPLPTGRKLNACERTRDCVRIDHLRLTIPKDENTMLRPASLRRGKVRGHMREQSANSYQLIVYIGVSAATGKERYHRETFRGPVQQACKRLDAIIRDVGRSTRRDTPVTVTDLLDRWLAHAGPDLSPTTLRTYRGYINNRIAPALGDIALTDLTPATLNDLYHQLSNEGLSPATIRQCHAIIHRALHIAQNWDLITTNPATHTTPPNTHPPPEHRTAPA